MNSLYFHHFKTLSLSFTTIIVLLVVLLIIGQSAAFLTLSIESGLGPLIFLEFLIRLIPVQFTFLMPICLIAAATSTFNAITTAGEHAILRAAGIGEASYFRPALAFGLVLAVIYIAFAFEIAPRSAASLKEIEENSAEQVAQNAIINPGEPTQVGPVEIFVAQTRGAQLGQMLIYGTGDGGQEIMLSAQSAEFTQGGTGLALQMEQGQILRLQDGKPQDAQTFDSVLIDLAAQVDADTSVRIDTEVRNQTFRQLLNWKAQSPSIAAAYRFEAAKRLAYALFIFAIPSWILFWQLAARSQRQGVARLTYVGPLTVVMALMIIEAIEPLFNQSILPVFPLLFLIFLSSAFGPLFFFLRGGMQQVGSIRQGVSS